MRKTLIAFAALVMLALPAWAQTNWPTPGGSQVDGKVVMCLNAAGQAVPVSGGTCANGQQVQPLFGRTKLLTATFTPGTSYAAGNDFGGAFSIAGGVGNNTLIQIRRVVVAGSAATLTASANLNFLAFSAATTTTFTDGASPTWNSADNAKFLLGTAVANITSTNGQISNAFLTAAATIDLPRTVTTDGSGNLNGVLIAGGTWTMTTPGQFTLTIEIGY